MADESAAIADVQKFETKDLVVTEVTIYADRAEVKRLVETKLVKGRNEIIVRNVSSFIDRDSVRVDGRGPAVIQEVQYQEKSVPVGEVDSEAVKKLEKAKKDKETEKAKIDDDIGVMRKRIEVLDGVATQIGNGPAVSADPEKKLGGFQLSDENLKNLSNFLDFFGQNANDTKTKLRELTVMQTKTQEDIYTLQRQINELRCCPVNMLRNISILLDSEDGGNVELDVSYQVYRASWKPTYDIRVVQNKGDKSTLKLSYYGLISQQTGEDWHDASLILSTATPSIAGTVPILGTTIVAFKPPPPPPSMEMADNTRFMRSGAPVRQKAMAMAPCSASFGSADGGAGALFGSVLAAAPMMNVMQTDIVESGTLSTRFTIARQSSIPSDGVEHKVTVAIFDLEPKFVHETVPSKSTFAFLTAHIVNTSTFPLLPGPTAIYLNNSFVAKSNLKAVSPGEDFDCSLGVDASVRIEYKPAHSFHEQTGLITKSSVDTHEQRISIKNTKNTEKITITLKEPIPKSTDDKIKVTLVYPDAKRMTNASNGESIADKVKLNKDNNLEWTMDIGANASKELLIKWTVEHPPTDKIEYKQA